MRILHIVAGLPPGGGIAESVPNLCRHLRQLGHEVTLATLDGPLSASARAAKAAGVRLVRFAPSWPRALYFSWQMLRGLPALARAADVVHVHSNWTFPVWWGCRCALKMGKPLVMSPRGCLDPVRLRHSVWEKRFVGWMDRYCLRRTAVIHATAACEREWVRAYLGTCDAEIAVIPNGVELEPRNTRKTRNGEEGEARILLCLGRLHPLKGLDLLVEAWARVRSSKVPTCESALFGEKKDGDVSRQDAKAQSTGEPLNEREARLNLEPLNPETIGWNLVIAGPDEQGTLKALKAQAERLGVSYEDKCVHALMRECLNEGEGIKAIAQSGNHAPSPDILFTGPLYGEEKTRALREADLFVLPTRSENFGIVVAEALACGVPVITTKGAPWEDLEKCVNAEMRDCLNEGEGKCENALMRECVNAEMPECGDRECVNAEMRDCLNAQKDNQAIRQLGNKAFMTSRAGWWVDIGVEPLVEALREAISLTDAERQAMGENGRWLAERKYRWEKVAEKMAEVYEKCVNARMR